MMNNCNLNFERDFHLHAHHWANISKKNEAKVLICQEYITFWLEKEFVSDLKYLSS